MAEANDLFPDCAGGDTEGRPKLSDIEFSAEDIAQAIGETRDIPSHAPEAVLYSPIKATVYYVEEIPRHWRDSIDVQDSQCCTCTHRWHLWHPENYKPTAFISHLIKVFEKLLRNHIVTYTERHGLFNPWQHGFRLGR